MYRRGFSLKIRQIHSIRAKLTAAFVLITLVLMVITVVLHGRAMDTIRATIYEEMLNNVAYFQNTMDQQINNIVRLQIDFFQDRKLPFLSGTDSLLSDYERREAFLSVQERLRSLTGISDLVSDGTLYFLKTGYRVTESNIGVMDEEQLEEMSSYLRVGNSDLHVVNGQYLIARTGEVRHTFSSTPNQLLVIRFSSDEITSQLDRLAQGRDGGAFLWDDANQLLLQNIEDPNSSAILSALSKDENGMYIPTQRISVNHRTFLVLTQPMQRGAVIIQYTPENEVSAFIRQSWLMTAVFLVVWILFSVLFILYVQRTVHRPLSILSRAFERMEEGVLTEHIHHDKEDEFAYIYERFNNTEDHLNQLIDEVYIQKNLIQKAQMKQLQAQINPHFLYNSFFILSRRIHREDLEGAEDLANHLGNYFKFLSRDQSDDLPLADEVMHARSYAAIQGARFAARMHIEFGQLPAGWETLRVPRLIIQPLLENAFKYGLENRAENALLRVQFKEVPPHELHITVEDNGETNADPDALQAAIEQPAPDVISGMANIHKRLNIFFHGQGGLKISRSPLGGIAVTIILINSQEDQQA